jgi:hypothetical protein
MTTSKLMIAGLVLSSTLVLTAQAQMTLDCFEDYLRAIPSLEGDRS